VEPSVPVKVRVLLEVRVLPSSTVKVEPVAGAVIVTLFKLVADATPKVGVTKVGEEDKTTLPEPVAEVTPVPPLPTGNVPVTPVVSDTLVIVLLKPEMVLPVKVSVPAKVARVPVVGSVTLVAAVEFRVVAKAPEVTKSPPRVIVLEALFTPVPP
jgi:hypothetical protein